ncbi:DNA polymerase alpha subunit B [Paramyrothecium foliicola]|nr:DNA polymerase alpha subunit B [Paramyrothecium foliicola]
MGLKVHYTFDKESKVNCLARYPHPVEVQTVSLDEVTTIGVIDVRTCIQAITDCSPELAGQDGDYTIYALDYSEPDTPLVGQGMLSWAIESIEQNTNTEEPKLVTGRVTKNILGVFGRGNRETLEVRLKLTAAAKIHRPEIQRVEIPQSHHVPQPMEMAMTPTGAAEWNSFIANNPQIGQPTANSRVASPAPSRGHQPPAPQRESSNLSQQATGPQEASRMTPTLVEFQVQMAPTASSRPSSRASNRPSRRKPPTGRPRGRPRKKPIEGNTSGYEDGTEGEEGPAKKRAKTTQVDKASINTFGAGHDSLRVAASTSGSIRTFRPVAMNPEPKAASHLQEVPRAPTPVPDGSGSGTLGRSLAQKLRRQSTMSQDNTPILPGPYPDPLPALSPSQEDGRSPESLAPTPVYSEDSPGDIGSSPPVPRTMPFPRSSLPPSSPILPPMPPPQLPEESSYSTTDMNELFGGDSLGPPETAPAFNTARKPNGPTNSTRAPFQVFQMQDGPNGQDMVQIKSYKTSRQLPASSRKVDPSGLPPLTLDSVADGSHPRCEKRPRVRSVRSPQAQGPTPPPTTDAVEKSISPMPTVEPTQILETRANFSKEASVVSTQEAEEMSTQSSREANMTTQADDCSFVPMPDDEPMIEQPFLDDSVAQKPQPNKSSLSIQEAEPSVLQPFRDNDTAGSVQPLESLVAPLPKASISKQPLPDTSKASQSKVSSSKPRQPRQLSRSQSAGPLVLPSIPASEPAGPSSLSQCTVAEPDRPKTAAAPAIRRSASTGPLCLPIPASDPVGPAPPMTTETSLPESRTLPPPSSPPLGRMSNKNVVKKYAIKQRLEEAINNGEMPPFCSNCGSIETPTWRKIWVKEVEGAPEDVEFSEKPGKVTAIEVLKRDEENKPTLHRVIKKSLFASEDRSTWQEQVLCNPCGIWLSKNNAHRPQDRWEKDASRRGQERRRRGGVVGSSRSKKARTKSDLPSMLTSEAYLPTDALGPVEPSSPGPTGTAPAPDRSFDEDGHHLQYLAPIEEATTTNEQPRSNPGSTHSRGDGTAKSPIDIELDEKLGSTRRVLFPSPKKDDTPRPLGELHINIMQTESRPHKDLIGDKENAIMLDVDVTMGGQDDLEALFRSPAVVRPSTPPPKEQSPTSLFKTPTRSTPSHRPVTRSVSRSIRASASRSLASPVRQALFQRTPTRTPRSVRRSPRNNQVSFDNVFDSPLSRTINQMLSEPNGFGLGDHELDLSSLPALEELDGRDGALIDFGNLLSTDAIMPSSPPKGTMLSFDYNASATMWAQWDVEHSVDLGDVKKEQSHQLPAMADTELESRFSPNKPLDQDVKTELKSIMRLHNLSAEDLFFKWESYCIKLDLDAQAVSLSAVRNLKQNIQDALEKSHRQAQVKTERKVAATPKASAKGGDVFNMLDGLVPSTPATGGRLSRIPGSGSALKRKMETPGAGITSSPAGGMSDQLKANGAQPSSFNDRANPGQVVEILNNDVPTAEPPIAPFPEPRVKVVPASEMKKMGYRPLAMKLSEASEILDDRIDEFMVAVQEYHSIEDSAFGSAASQSTSEIVAVGRIASDSPEGKLNVASLVLETSRRTGMGFRIPLKMDKIRNWSFFPGQIVALKGSNASGNEFVVNEVLDIPLLPGAASTISALEAHRERLRGGPDAMDSDTEPSPLNIIYASGPYSADDNLDFEPLHALCSQAADTLADTLVLTGPFLDIDHPLIATGDFDLPDEAMQDPDTVNMNTVFKYLFAPALNKLATSNPHITIILVPSVRDIIDKHVSWPQDIISRKTLGLPKAARIFTNPSTLSVNEMVLGVSSHDVLYELRSEEVTKGGGDLKARLGRYLVEQRHYLPVFPPADRARLPKTGTEEGLATGAMLDVSYLKLGEMVSVRPDVMMVPSSLPPFAEVVESVLIINPGLLSKRRGAGTYARMTLHPPSAGDNAKDGMVSHEVFRRARVEIVRI